MPDLSHRAFQIQQSHARCCSLIRQLDPGLFHQLTERELTTASPDSWQWSPSHIQCLHPTARSLIQKFLQVLDWSVTPPPNPTKQFFLLAEQVSTDFYKFHQDCQPFNPQFELDRDRRHTYVAVLMNTRHVLCQLLRGLKLDAPVEL